MDYVIRPVRADEWQLVKELRLAALQDPVAPVAFLETFEEAGERSDGFWRERTARGSEAGDGGVRQFIAEATDGSWAGTVTVLIERPDGEVRFGEAAAVHQAHVVGVFVRPEARGRGLAEELFRAGTDWAWSLGEPLIERVRLYVHEDNPRAAAFYRRIGFVPTGESVPMPGDPAARELEYAVVRP
ncbi:GNAT family N-acetyltransferase [Streptomyces poriferorum]|uniref:GNAT family N-acetyltransferase n=1 Tax=Streptomyces poriferorum TaxID=2798799 RepID=A0ABY9IRT4_9ACTN|nr:MULTISPECIES: GNAT family N-acetyltransferase [Streptomyces]MBW5262204.1 GNAT family N-acetyltransferase [Streptomyces poriferorum]MDP5313515.1 GNAT family N-acetyltransferase [Streptomyces sp. Alt4]WLQ49801.1 GNAT family N-acetyltransferase [Streptomyces sp. Alt1]WLQ57514.1 GNAT family N-acetyltransferase [Streptomyces sp. Alt2]WSI64619.1 GNAT family N-acetyltransferase [Streptomyces sp. NBC_01336]